MSTVIKDSTIQVGVRLGFGDTTEISFYPHEELVKINSPIFKTQKAFFDLGSIEPKSFEKIYKNRENLNAIQLKNKNVARLHRAAEVLKLPDFAEKCVAFLKSPKATFSDDDKTKHVISPALIEISAYLKRVQFPVSLQILNPQILTRLNQYAQTLDKTFPISLSEIPTFLGSAIFLEINTLKIQCLSFIEEQIKIFDKMPEQALMNEKTCLEFLTFFSHCYKVEFLTFSIQAYLGDPEKINVYLDRIAKLIYKKNLKTSKIAIVLEKYKVSFETLNIDISNTDDFATLEILLKTQTSLKTLNISINEKCQLEQEQLENLTEALKPVASTLTCFSFTYSRVEPLDSLSFLTPLTQLKNLKLHTKISNCLWSFLKILENLETLHLDKQLKIYYNQKLSFYLAQINLNLCKKLKEICIGTEKITPSINQYGEIEWSELKLVQHFKASIKTTFPTEDLKLVLK